MKWFRMYASLVDSIKVGPLPHASFRAYVELLCLACEKESAGRTGVTKDSIAWRLRRDASCDVTALVTAGLVTVGRDGEYVIVDWDARQMRSDTSAERTRAYRDRKAKINKGIDAGDRHGDGVGDGHIAGGDGTEKRRGEESRTTPLYTAVPAEAVPACDFDSNVELYHEALPTCPRVAALSEARRAKIRARWRERWELNGKAGNSRTTADLLNWFAKFFGHCAASDFLTGKSAPTPGRPPFVASLDWLMTQGNFLKVVEGSYHR